MAKIIDVKDISQKINLTWHQLTLPVDDEKVMILQLNEGCNYCKGLEKKEKKYWEESFMKQYRKLSKEELLAAMVIPSKILFSRLSQVVRCVGCRRSCENLFNQLKDTGDPSMEPFMVTNNGILTIFMNCSLQPNALSNLFSSHDTPLTKMLENIPKYKKSGRCILHSMDGVRSRNGSQAWLYMWEDMSKECQESVTHISCDKLLITLDNYLRKHRFCHECKNKVHRAYNILVGNINIDPNKEKGYVGSLYAGITKCGKTHIQVRSETDFVMHLITRAEPELQGRRERHAKTLEIAQEEVLTCVGLFLYERLQKIYLLMKEEEQAFDILFHVGLDAFKRNFEMAVEEKQGFSKFEKLCEELQREELLEKAKREKKKRKKNKKRNEETKENNFIVSEEEEEEDDEEEETSCNDCDIIPIKSSLQTSVQQLPLQSLHEDFAPPTNNSKEEWRTVGDPHPVRKSSIELETSKSVCIENKDSNSDEFLHHHHHHHHHSQHSSPQHFECSTSIDSLASRCSQCSRDGGYCSAQCSSGSSRDSSEVACGDGFCAHSEELESSTNGDHRHHGLHGLEQDNINFIHSSIGAPKQCSLYAPSLQEMLEDFSGDTDEIPEAEVKAWHDQLGSVKQKRAELRQTLRQRFQQLCYRKGIRNVQL